jgi:hypothetical protein
MTVEYKREVRKAVKETSYDCFLIDVKGIKSLANEIGASKVVHRVDQHRAGNQTAQVAFIFDSERQLIINYHYKQGNFTGGRDQTYFEVVAYTGSGMHRHEDILDTTVLTMTRRIAQKEGFCK